MADMEQLLPYLELGLSLRSFHTTFSPRLVNGVIQVIRQEYLMESEWAEEETFSLQDISEHIQRAKRDAEQRRQQDEDWKQAYPYDQLPDYYESSDWEQDWGVLFVSNRSEKAEYDIDEINRQLNASQGLYLFNQWVEGPLSDEQKARLPLFFESLSKPREIFSFFVGPSEAASQLLPTRQTKAEREKTNALLKAYGFIWKPGARNGDWMLIGPDKEVSSVGSAMQEIKRLQEPVYGHASALWASLILNGSAVILDSETTGIRTDDEIVELAVVNLQGKKIVNSLFQTQRPIPASATKVHRITNRMVHNARTFPQIWDELMTFLQKREIIIFNADFDLRMLRQTAQHYNLPIPELRVHCLMKRVSNYIGGAKGQYSLKAACYHFGIEQEEAHRALPDTLVTLAVLQALAARAEPPGNL